MLAWGRGRWALSQKRIMIRNNLVNIVLSFTSPSNSNNKMLFIWSRQANPSLISSLKLKNRQRPLVFPQNDIILQGNQWWFCAMSAVFLRCLTSNPFVASYVNDHLHGQPFVSNQLHTGGSRRYVYC